VPEPQDDPTQLYALAEELRSLCEARSMKPLDDDQDRRYVDLRNVIVANPLTRDRAPAFLRDCRKPLDFWGFIRKFPTYAERRGFLLKEFSPLLNFLEGRHDSSPSVAAVVLEKLDSDHVRRAWKAATARVETDPEGAMTSARTLVETVCKHLLDEIGGVYKDEDDLPRLYKTLAKAMSLSPSQHEEEVFRQILGGCTAVVEGLGALRNRLGDAHGRSRKAARPEPRHAELVVSLAFSMCVFLVQTWESRNAKR
jgi:hypothetical protein